LSGQGLARFGSMFCRALFSRPVRLERHSQRESGVLRIVPWPDRVIEHVGLPFLTGDRIHFGELLLRSNVNVGRKCSIQFVERRTWNGRGLATAKGLSAEQGRGSFESSPQRDVAPPSQRG
jgi:hypothetical protein